jgi:hypothetical protein
MAKDDLRIETGDFLDNFEGSSTFGVSNVATNATNIQYPSLTGAYPAVLPMRISTIGSNGQRVSFTLLINPETWNEGRPFISQVTYTRTGWVPQLWGPNQDNISSTGKTAAFMTESTGMDYMTRNQSFGYLNFLSLLAAYRNNGYQFQDFMQVAQITRVVNLVYGVQIEYDSNLLTGHFNNFTLDESEESPFVFNYNFEFVTTSLDGNNDSQIKGHYKSLPLTTNSSEPTTNLSNYVVVPKASSTNTVIRIWEQTTGLLWSDALNLKLTDGSEIGNKNLLTNLTTKIWDPATKTFKGNKN